jgi:hypothetical protein
VIEIKHTHGMDAAMEYDGKGWKRTWNITKRKDEDKRLLAQIRCRHEL